MMSIPLFSSFTFTCGRKQKRKEKVCSFKLKRTLMDGSKVAQLYLSGLARTSQFLNGMQEFPELVLARVALLMDQNRADLPL